MPKRIIYNCSSCCHPVYIYAKVEVLPFDYSLYGRSVSNYGTYITVYYPTLESPVIIKQTIISASCNETIRTYDVTNIVQITSYANRIINAVDSDYDSVYTYSFTRQFMIPLNENRNELLFGGYRIQFRNPNGNGQYLSNYTINFTNMPQSGSSRSYHFEGAEIAAVSYNGPYFNANVVECDNVPPRTNSTKDGITYVGN